MRCIGLTDLALDFRLRVPKEGLNIWDGFTHRYPSTVTCFFFYFLKKKLAIFGISLVLSLYVYIKTACNTNIFGFSWCKTTNS